MKIVYRGNFGPRHSTETHIAASLESLGHTVVRVQEDAAGWVATVDECLDADLFLWTSTHSYADKHEAAEAEAVEQLNELLPTAAVHLDLFFGLRRSTWVNDCGWFKLSHVFTADGDHDAEFAAAGVNHHWLMPGVFDVECFRGNARDEYRSDIAFVGAHTRGYHPEYKGRMALVDELRNAYGERCKFWPEPGKHAIRNDDLNDLYASAKVIVGDSCFADTAERYTSDRVFETVGRGGFLLYPRIKCVEAELNDGVHLVFFEPGNFEDLRAKVEYWLRPEQDAQRNAIQSAGSAYVRENCSYVRRMERMLEVIGLA